MVLSGLFNAEQKKRGGDSRSAVPLCGTHTDSFHVDTLTPASESVCNSFEDLQWRSTLAAQ